MFLHGETHRFKCYKILRQTVSQWARQNYRTLVGPCLTQGQYLMQHMGKGELTLEDYDVWWKNIEETDCYVETPVLMALSIYLNYNICVRRKSDTGSAFCLRFFGTKCAETDTRDPNWKAPFTRWPFHTAD